MGLLGLSLIVASVVYVIIRPPSWLPPLMLSWLQRIATTSATITATIAAAATASAARRDEKDDASEKQTRPPPTPRRRPPTPPAIIAPGSNVDADRAAMPPPPLPTSRSPAASQAPPPPPPPAPSIALEEAEPQPESPTTPKAIAPPSFSFSTASMPPKPPRTTTTPPATSTASPSSSASSASSMMPPPPLPRQAGLRPPTLSQFPAANSAQRARGGPVPNRGPARVPSAASASSSSSSSLAPPPTHTAVPAKPSRQVVLEPGHSPLDWARISGPDADLRGLEPASTPYLRVTPSMLRRQTGRRGSDAWMALSGHVYNVSPYAKFHPGGVPELMRGAARDATRLFGEIHPWVNYESMLAACLVGILVDEPENTAGDNARSEMEEMD